MEKYGIYIHVPYCASKCIYCDFFSGGAKAADWGAYVAALLNEFEQRREEMIGEPSTLYIGGGTPSLLPYKEFGRLAEGIRRIADKKDEWSEMTIEVNPEDVTEEACFNWLQNGVNRVSMGVQSFSDDELKIIKRRHSASKAIEATHILKKYFNNISLDLMFGLPGQTEESWRVSIGTALSLEPNHLSAYSLMLEEGTPLTALHEKGRLTLPEEDESLTFFNILTEKLRESGYLQYEISNFALPGFESKHNRSYWQGTPYIGLGPAAHSYDGYKIRRSNPWKLNEYLRYFNHEREGRFYEEEILTSKELLEEKLMLSMRMSEGIDLRNLKDSFGDRSVKMVLNRAKPYMTDGKLELIDDHLRLTHNGIMIADRIIIDLLP